MGKGYDLGKLAGIRFVAHSSFFCRRPGVVTGKDAIVGVLCPDTLFRLVTLAVEQEPVPRLFHQTPP